MRRCALSVYAGLDVIAYSTQPRPLPEIILKNLAFLFSTAVREIDRRADMQPCSPGQDEEAGLFGECCFLLLTKSA